MNHHAEVAGDCGQVFRDDGRLPLQGDPALLGERLSRPAGLLGRLGLHADAEADPMLGAGRAGGPGEVEDAGSVPSAWSR